MKTQKESPSIMYLKLLAILLFTAYLTTTTTIHFSQYSTLDLILVGGSLVTLLPACSPENIIDNEIYYPIPVLVNYGLHN